MSQIKHYKYNNGKIDVPVRIGDIRGKFSEKGKDYVDVKVLVREIMVNKSYCEEIRRLSEEQLGERGYETRFRINFDKRAKKYRKVEAREAIDDKVKNLVVELVRDRLIFN